MTIIDIKIMSRIVLNDVGFELAFIGQNYTMQKTSPKKISAVFKSGRLNRRRTVGLWLQFFAEKMLRSGKNHKANKEDNSGGKESS